VRTEDLAKKPKRFALSMPWHSSVLKIDLIERLFRDAERTYSYRWVLVGCCNKNKCNFE